MENTDDIIIDGVSWQTKKIVEYYSPKNIKNQTSLFQKKSDFLRH
jgi:hypothetical protein